MQDKLSLVAIAISIISIMISFYINYNDERPYLCLKSVKFNRDEFRICKLGGESVKEINEIVCRTVGTISVQKIEGKEYLLFNLLKEEVDLNNSSLILNPMECEYCNRGGAINEIELIKFSMTYKDKPNKLISKKINKGEKLIVFDNDKIIFRIAYACINDSISSLDYNKLLNLNKFDYLMDVPIAKKIIRFRDENFKLRCKNYKGKKYYNTITLSCDDLKGLIFDIKQK